MRRKGIVIAAALIAALASQALGAELVNMEFKQAPLGEVLQILGQLGGYNVLVDSSVRGEVSFVLKDLSVQEALDLVTKTTGYGYQLVGNTLVFASEERLRSEFGSEGVRFVSIAHVAADDARALVSMVVPNVRSFVDAKHNLVVLYGPEKDLEVAERVLRQYDQQAGGKAVPAQALPQETPLKAGEEQLSFYAVPIEYADGQGILTMLRHLLPQREFAFHPESGLLSARTTPEEWETLKVVIARHDLPELALKGILRSADQAVALVEHEGVSHFLKLGDELVGWTLTEVGDGTAQFTQGERSFVVRLGR